jgi:hypothetical protein
MYVNPHMSWKENTSYHVCISIYTGWKKTLAKSDELDIKKNRAGELDFQIITLHKSLM